MDPGRLAVSAFSTTIASPCVFDCPKGTCDAHAASRSSHGGVDGGFRCDDDGSGTSMRVKEERWRGMGLMVPTLADLLSMVDTRCDTEAVMKARPRPPFMPSLPLLSMVAEFV